MMFDYPELVAQLVLYLSPQDLARCSATCKTFAKIFEPYLYQKITLEAKNSVPPVLQRYLQHIRVLGIHSSDTQGCLMALAKVLNLAGTTSTPSTTASPPRRMISLQKLTVNTICDGVRTYPPGTLKTIISILRHSNRITHLELRMYTKFSESSIDPRLLDKIRTGLPRLQRFIASGGSAFPIVEAMESLKVCLGHPSLTDVQFYTDIERRHGSPSDNSADKAHFDSLLEFLNGLNKPGAQSQGANGCQLTSLTLPHIKGGYPRSFLLPLLTTYLPQLERFQIPVLDGPYEGELEEVIASHCRLRHVSYTFPMDDREQNSSVIKAVIRGCARRIGLKSIFIFGYNVGLDTNSSYGLVETLVEYHSKTLESVEFQAWNYNYRPFQLDAIFSDCWNLKSFKASRNEETMHNWMWFFHLPRYQWLFRGLKELYLHFHQYELYSDSVDMAKAELEAGEMMFKLIGGLIRLEVLALDFRYHRYETAACWGFDDSIEDKWVRKLARLDNLRYLSMPLECWNEGNLSKIIDSRWPRLERVSSRDLRQETCKGEDSTFYWLKERRPWLKIGDLE